MLIYSEALLKLFDFDQKLTPLVVQILGILIVLVQTPDIHICSQFQLRPPTCAMGPLSIVMRLRCPFAFLAGNSDEDVSLQMTCTKSPPLAVQLEPSLTEQLRSNLVIIQCLSANRPAESLPIPVDRQDCHCNLQDGLYHLTHNR